MNSDLERLQGTWLIASLEMEGQRYPPGGGKLLVQGERFISLNMGAEYEGILMVDNAIQPHTFELRFDKGPEAGNSSLGIYELDGDVWRICLGLTGRTRPPGFVTQPGSGHVLEILHRSS